MARHHVLRQAAQQVGRQRSLPVASAGRVLQDHVGHQLLAVEHQHHGFTHVSVFGQARFDFPQFNAQPAQFDLMVETAQVFDHPVHALAYPVAGAVQALAVMERARHKAFGGQPRTSMVVTGQTGASQIQLACHTHCHRRQVSVEHHGAQVGNGQANGHAGCAFIDTGPVRDVDGGFSRAIQVVQLGTRQLGKHLLLSVHRQGFTAAHNAAQAGAVLHTGFVDKGLQHRRHEMQGADLMLADGVDQAQRLAVFTGLRHHQPCPGEQWPEKLPH